MIQSSYIDILEEESLSKALSKLLKERGVNYFQHKQSYKKPFMEIDL